MKKIVYGFTVLLLMFLAMWFYLSSGTVTHGNLEQTQVYIENTQIAFGSLEQNIPKQAVFNLKNTGNAPLLIQNVETSCGCTLPEWTKHPVKPGKSGEVRVTYDAEYPGRFHKTITVYANVEESPIRLTILGEVELEEQDEDIVQVK